MPVCIPDALPAAKVLASENIFVMTRQRSTHQDIRPLHIAMLNLMPTKEAYRDAAAARDRQHAPQVEVTLPAHGNAPVAAHRAPQHLETFYRTFEEVREEKFDGSSSLARRWSRWNSRKSATGAELERHDGVGRGARVLHDVHLLGRAGGPVLPLRRPKDALTEKMHSACSRTAWSTDRARWCAGLTTSSSPPSPPHRGARGGHRRQQTADPWSSPRRTGVVPDRLPRRRAHLVFATGHAEYDADTLADGVRARREPRACPSPCRATTSPTTTPPRSPWSPGAPTPTCSTRTGSTTTSTRRRHIRRLWRGSKLPRHVPRLKF